MKQAPLRSLASILLVWSWPAIAQITSPFGEQIRDFGGATLLTPHLVSFLDYPGQALSNAVQGRVVVAFDINVKGRVENCAVKLSSGHKELDVVPCPLLERKSRFDSPVNDAGSPRATKGIYSVDFWLP
ncbi:energy transducer TonB [Sphingomonas sp. RB1R13]|uniref:energy transducer TonB n=1 Tax=Sphingomonas sp. RB1R13 TaxID=3096159 RepID=UPI002FC81416